MKALFLALTCLVSTLPQEPRKAADVPNPSITIKYDRFADTTTVTVVARLPPNTKFDAVMFGVGAVVKGEDLSQNVPTASSIVVSSRSKDWVFLTTGTVLRMILDGKERLLIGEMKRSPGEVLKTGRGVIEQLSLRVPFSLIEQMSKASKLEMQVGLEEFELTRSQLDDLRQWVRQFPAAQSKPTPITKTRP